jgi:hypothetical protein
MKQRLILTAPTITAEQAHNVQQAIHNHWPDLDVMVVGGATSATLVPTVGASEPYTPQPISDDTYAEHRRSS